MEAQIRQTLDLVRQPSIDGLTIFALKKAPKELSYQELKERYHRLIQKRRNQSLTLKRLQRAHYITLQELANERRRNERLVRDEVRDLLRRI